VSTPASSGENLSWPDAVQETVNLSDRGEYRQGLQSYQHLLSTPPFTSNLELRAYLLSQMAGLDIELGEYPEAETRTREALNILVSTEKTHTITYAIAEEVLARWTC
jgi:hypothetical protein